MDVDGFQNKWTDQDVEQHWDDVADIYVEENLRVEEAHNQRFVRALELLDAAPGDRLLNITSRDCGVLSFMDTSSEGVNVLNAEISAGLMGRAAEIYPEADQVKIDSYSSIPFSSDEFDRVLSFETLEHVANPVAFLKELLRVTKPGGTMVLSCPPATSEIPYRLYSVLCGGHGEGPHKFPSSKQVKSWVELTGWELVHHEGTLLMPVGPKKLQAFGEKMIKRFQNTFISELGIRQFYVCKKQS